MGSRLPSILGPRWVRDHADEKKATLAAVLEKAFDPKADTACIGLDQAARDAAGAWLPPGIAAGGNTMQGGGDAGPDGDPDPEHGEFADFDAAATNLPAFLTEEESAPAEVNAASAD
jgi:hypothetical protein